MYIFFILPRVALLCMHIELGGIAVTIDSEIVSNFLSIIVENKLSKNADIAMTEVKCEIKKSNDYEYR